MIYLASPYSDPDPLMRKTRFLLAREFVAKQFPKHIYSPIVHYHELATYYDLPTDFETWKTLNFDMIRRADAFWILDIPGWYESKGVTAEGDFARMCGFDLQLTSGNEWPGL